MPKLNKIAAMYKKNPVPTLIGGGVVIVGSILILRKIFGGDRVRIKKVVYRKVPKTIIDPVTGEKKTVMITVWSPEPLAVALYNSMEGWNYGFGGAIFQAWNDLSAQDDSRLVAVYNAYNEIAARKNDKMSLVERIADEVIGYSQSRIKLQARFSALQLT